MIEPGRMKNHVWDKKLAFELYKEGKTDKEIAEACGISNTTVQTWRKRQGLPVNVGKKKTRKLTPLEADAVAARKAGLTYGQYKAQQREQEKRGKR